MEAVDKRADVATEVASIVALTQALVQTPSQGGIDPLEPILNVLYAWFADNQIPCRLLHDTVGRPVAFLGEVDSGRPGPAICLDAPIDTAPIGKREAWRVDPFRAGVEGNRIVGRGVADAKVGAAIFSHVARRVMNERSRLRGGKLLVLFDGDEHTGQFGGIRSFVEVHGIRPSFVALGYPGNYGVKIGARGFFRVTIRVHGTERHSGSQADTRAQNAIVKSAKLVEELSSIELPSEGGDFTLGPKLSVTEIAGGQGYSQIPGVCTVKIDVRLTPRFAYAEARAMITEVVSRVDRAMPTERASQIAEEESWPAYRLAPDNRYVKHLREAAENAFRKRVELVVCGPSNIGNYLASHGISSVCGFGVSYDHQHAANEYVELDTIGPVFDTYYHAVLAMCAEGVDPDLAPN